MRSDYTYETHQAIEAAQLRHREREFEHSRALKGDSLSDAVLARMMGSLRRLRPARLRPPIALDHAFVLTERACRLPSGGMGRIAVHESDGESIEVCVQV